MPAIRIPAMDSNSIQAAAVKSSDRQAKAAESIQVTFSNYISKNSANSAAAAGQQNVTPETVVKAKESSVKESYSQYQNKAEARAGSIKTQESKTPDSNAEAVDDALQDAETQIKELLEEELGVDGEQIDAAMELLGLTSLDLLNPNQLAALTVELTGSQDIGAVLFNESFQDILQGVSVITDNFLQELGMTMEELTAQVELQMQPQTQEVQQEVQQIPTDSSIQQPEQPEIANAYAEVPDQTVEQTVVVAQDNVAKESVQADAKPEIVQNSSSETVEVQRPQEAVQEVSQNDSGEESQQQLQGRENESQSQDTEQMPSQSTEQENGFGNKNQTQFENEAGQENGHFEFTPHVHRQDSQAPVQNPVNQAPMPQVDVHDVIRQIVEYTKVSLTQQVKTIEMQLNPENLGKVFLHISEKQGVVTAQITAQNENLKEALIQQAAELKDNLNQQGVKVEAVEVSVGTHEFEKNLEKDARQQEEQERQQEEQQSANSRRSINLNDLSDLEGLSGLMSEEEALVAQMMRDNGNQVDFKA